MKAFTCDVILTSVSSRVDGSLGLRFSTPELDSAEKTAVFDLQNKRLKMLLQPDEGEAEGLTDVKGELAQRSPGQRLRAVLFMRWKYTNPGNTFDDYYNHRMNQFIEAEKKQLPPQEL
jgi:ribonucleotide reductase alpha subunit